MDNLKRDPRLRESGRQMEPERLSCCFANKKPSVRSKCEEMRCERILNSFGSVRLPQLRCFVR